MWVTVKSQLAFTPDGKVSAVIHDWVFDEMYSSFATQGLAPAGQLVKKEQFAPLAKENAGSLAEIGYFTTLKIGGSAVDFGSVTDYWMQERPDHLVEFHVTVPLKTPTAITKFLTLRVADPEYFIDFEFDDKDPMKLGLRAVGMHGERRQAEAARGERQAEAERVLLHQPLAGKPISVSKWRAPPSSRAHDEALDRVDRPWMRMLGAHRPRPRWRSFRRGRSPSPAARAEAEAKAALRAGSWPSNRRSPISWPPRCTR